MTGARRRKFLIIGVILLLVGLASIAAATFLRTSQPKPPEFVADSTTGRDFKQRKTYTGRGDILLIGNTVITCPDDAIGTTRCADAREGRGPYLYNNQWSQIVPEFKWVNIERGGTYFNSSSADLAIPVGAKVEWAGLYWNGKFRQIDPAFPDINRRKVQFATPTAGYTELTAGEIDGYDLNPGSSSPAYYYNAFADVTKLVQAAGSGTYKVANIATYTKATVANSDPIGGWALAVIYSSNTGTLRNLSVFDGIRFVTQGSQISFNLTGIVTPATGPVGAILGFVGLDGDMGVADELRINNRVVSNTANPANDVFNSSISRYNGSIDRNPLYKNQLGYDIDLFDITGYFGNSQQSVNFNFRAPASEGTIPVVLSIAIDVSLAELSIDKSVVDINGGRVEPGDVLEYTMQVTNVGTDNAINVKLEDAIPANTIYLPDSLEITAGANTGRKTDQTGDDQASYDATAKKVNFNLGAGATATNGGRLAPGASTTTRFRITVDSTLTAATAISNTANTTGDSETLGDDLTASDTATVNVEIPKRCYRCTPALDDTNECEIASTTFDSCPAGTSEDPVGCATASENGICPAEINCYRCSASLADGNACESFVHPGSICPSGSTTSPTGCQEAAGGVCPAETTCYRCTPGLSDVDACESFVHPGAVCPDGSTSTAGACNEAAGGFCPAQITCYSCTSSQSDGNTCESFVHNGSSCPAGSSPDANGCDEAAGGVCPAQVTCYRCTPSLSDSDACESFVESGMSCPTGSTPTPGACNEAAGGVCPAQTTCYRCTSGLTDGNACEAFVVQGSSCPADSTTDPNACATAAGGNCPVQVTCYRCTTATNDSNACESFTQAGPNCPLGTTPNAGACAIAAGGACPVQRTCYTCTTALTDQNACSGFTVASDTCPAGSSETINGCAQSVGGACPMTECSDGIDNDGDGRIDCNAGNADPGCYPNGNGGGGSCNPLDDSEQNGASPLPRTALISDDVDRFLISIFIIVAGFVMLRLRLVDNLWLSAVLPQMVTGLKRRRRLTVGE